MLKTWSVTICPVCGGKSKVQRMRGALSMIAECGDCGYLYSLGYPDTLLTILRDEAREKSTEVWGGGRAER